MSRSIDDTMLRDLIRMSNDRQIETRTRNKIRVIINYVRELERAVRGAQGG
jgi:hypothetical protein